MNDTDDFTEWAVRVRWMKKPLLVRIALTEWKQLRREDVGWPVRLFALLFALVVGPFLYWFVKDFDKDMWDEPSYWVKREG
jgi:hypothetical protein